MPEQGIVRDAETGEAVIAEIETLDARIDELSYEINFLRAIRDGLRQVEAGELVTHGDAVAELRAIFRN